MDALSAKRTLVRVLGVVNGNLVQIQETRLRCVRFLLFNVTNPVTPTQILEGFAQTAETDLRELLVGLLAEIHATLEVKVVTADNRTDFVFDTEIDDISRGFANVILHAAIPFTGKSRKAFGLFKPLLIGDTLEIGFLLVPPLVD